MRLQELADYLGGQLVMPAAGGATPAVQLTGVAPLPTAKAGDVTFLNNTEYARYLPTTAASVVLLQVAAPECRVPQIVHKNPYWAFAKTAQLFYQPERFPSGVSERAFVAKGARLGKNVSILPFVYVGEEVVIGDEVTLYPGVYLGRGVEVGVQSILRANVVIEQAVKIGARVLIHANTVIGADGFGFAPGPEGICKIPQTGRVLIADDVEIGANSSVDRGAMSDTSIGRDSKLDSHVHVGHNVTVGEHCMLCGMAAIAGSAKLGNWVILAGHSGVTNHVEIGDGVQVGAMAGVTKSLPKAGQYMGFPVQPAADWRKLQAYARRLPRLDERVKELERQLAELKTALQQR